MKRSLILVASAALLLLTQQVEAQPASAQGQKRPKCGCPSVQLEWDAKAGACLLPKGKCEPCRQPGTTLFHPKCKCYSTKVVKLIEKKFEDQYYKCVQKNNLLEEQTNEFGRCAGLLIKCTMYEKWNWKKCKCERKNYCKTGCPADQSLHPGYYCKCLDFIDEIIPTTHLKEETEAGCGPDHYYSEDADYCVAYNWCPKWHECGEDTIWSQDKCDCIARKAAAETQSEEPDPIITADGPKRTDRKKETKKPFVNPTAPATHRVKKPTKPQVKEQEISYDDDQQTEISADEEPEKIIAEEIKPVEKTPICQKDDTGIEYMYDENAGLCIEVGGAHPICSPDKEWSRHQSTCVCKSDKCRTNETVRWYNNSCKCFTDRLWCSVLECADGRKSLSFGSGSKQHCKCVKMKVPKLTTARYMKNRTQHRISPMDLVDWN